MRVLGEGRRAGKRGVGMGKPGIGGTGVDGVGGVGDSGKSGKAGLSIIAVAVFPAVTIGLASFSSRLANGAPATVIAIGIRIINHEIVDNSIMRIEPLR